MPKKMTKEERDEAIEKYIKAYDCSIKEAEELLVFDMKYTDSDKDTREYLEKNYGLKAEEVDNMFYKMPKVSKKVVVPKDVTARTRNEQESRINYIAEKIAENYKNFFGDPENIEANCLTYRAPETGLPISIKIAKHKTQKVVTKEIKKKENAPITDTDQRVMALREILEGAPELFPVLAPAGASFGFVISNNVKYPFGSIRITHHKK